MSFSHGALQPNAALSAQKGIKRRPYVTSHDGELSLYFDNAAVQSRMKLSAPTDLVLEYTQHLMGFLLLKPAPARIAMIGLGGGSIAKYCMRYLRPEKFTAVEVDPDVIAARSKFLVPPDSKRFEVIEADGADFVQDRSRQFDVIIVDGYTAEGLPPLLCSTGFYDNCNARLSDDGVVALNFLHSDPKYGIYTSRLRETFSGGVVSIETAPYDNRIVFASRGKEFPPKAAVIQARARALAGKHTVNFQGIAKKLVDRLKVRPANDEEDLFAF
jgi:spermidine synthase